MRRSYKMLPFSCCLVLFFSVIFFSTIASAQEEDGVNDIPAKNVTDDPQGQLPNPRGSVFSFIKLSPDHQVFTRLLQMDSPGTQDSTSVYLDGDLSRALVFAPSDSAWADYARFVFQYTGVELDASDPDSVYDALLAGWENLARAGSDNVPSAYRMVRYHVVPRGDAYPALSALGSANTLAGESLSFDGDTIIDLDDTYNVTAESPRYLLTNGWVVPVYQVLIPFNMSEAHDVINKLPSTTPTRTPTPSGLSSSPPPTEMSPLASSSATPDASSVPPSSTESVGPIDTTFTPPPGVTDGPGFTDGPIDESPGVPPPVVSMSASPSLGSPPSASSSIPASPSASMSFGSSPLASFSPDVFPSDNGPETELMPSGSEEGDGDGVCFPASALVHIADGSRVAMKDLKAGDVVMHSESGESSSIFLFTHRTHKTVAVFRQLSTACGHNLKLTANHYVYANGRLTAAGVVRVGDIVRTVSGDCAVTDVRSVKDFGLFAPHSVHGDLVVDGVVVSGYSRAVSPKVAHALLAPVRWFVGASGVTEPLGSAFYSGANWALHVLPRGFDKY